MNATKCSILAMQYYAVNNTKRFKRHSAIGTADFSYTFEVAHHESRLGNGNPL